MMKDDLISRADAIEAVAEDLASALNVSKDETRELAEHALSALPSAEVETKCIAQIKVDVDEIVERIKEEYGIMNRWIPCSERLPEKGDLVLATVWNDVVIAWRNQCGVWESAEDIYVKGDVTAWMPLPKPYSEDGE